MATIPLIHVSVMCVTCRPGLFALPDVKAETVSGEVAHMSSPFRGARDVCEGRTIAVSKPTNVVVLSSAQGPVKSVD